MSVKCYKKISYLLYGMMLFIMSCTDNIVNNGDNPVGGGGDGEDLIPVVLNLKGLFGEENSPSTYSLTNLGDSAGTGLENDIGDVTVYIFNSSNVCEKILQKINPASPPSIGPELVKTGYKTFIAVVNGIGKLPATYTDPAGYASVNYNALRQALTNVITTLPTDTFLMTGTTTATLSVEDKDAPNEVEVDVERAVAKIKIFITKSGKASSHDIKMQKITLHQGANQVYLLQPPASNTTSYNLSSEKTSFTLSGEVPTSGYCALADSFYTYESLCGSDNSKAVYFELEAEVNSPANVRKARFYLAEDASSGVKLYNVHRNYWYEVYINIKDPGMDSVYITVKSSPWNVAETQNVDAWGGYFVETALPFRLVKNYTQAERVAHPEMLAIDKHSKGASWLDLIVAKDTAWMLEFTGGSLTDGSIISVDSGKTWKTEKVIGTGKDDIQRVYIYRPYVENAEPASGPTFSWTVGGTVSGNTVVGGKKVREFVLRPRDTIPIPTNCYILRPQLQGVPHNKSIAYIPLKGVYRYWEDYLLNNGDTIPGGTVTAELLWQDQPGVIKNSAAILNKNDIREDAYLYVEAGEKQGNAVVAMKVDSKIYWSFHVWVTEYNPYEAAGQKLYATTGNTLKNIFMDRNIGALSNKNDGKAFGLYYQFGRKDPFPGAMYDLSGTPISIPVSSTLTAASSFRPLEAIPTVLNNPITYYNSGGSWPLSQEDSCLWNTPGGKKTVFDPCPEGWRIPKQKGAADINSPWYGLTTTNFVTTNPGYDNGRYHATAGYYPFSGYMVNSGSAITAPAPGSEAYYWTSWNKSATNGTGLRIHSSAGVTPLSDIPKYYGVSVRCVVDRQYLLSVNGGGLFGSAEGMEDNIKE
jgi:uncharacterized protein (TIGR02145 family)